MIVRRMPLFALVAVACASPVLHADELPPKAVISREQLVEVLDTVTTWATEASELRGLAKGLEVRDFVARADAIRSGFDELMILMASTEPPAEQKQAAILLLMGTKGVELALWHYIYGAMAGHAASVDHGDVVLKAAVSQIAAARTLFAR